jgi:hypothetical protein
MKRQLRICSLVFLILAVGAPALAQVNKVMADAKGIT